MCKINPLIHEFGPTIMRNMFQLLLLTVVMCSAFGCAGAQPVKPLQALLITGGCCHDYKFQSEKLTTGSSALANIQWTVMLDPRTGTEGEIDLYDKPDWAAPYDVVVHNECFANTADPEYIRKITKAHRANVPAVVIHCAMHTYRAAEIDDWRQFLGVTSRRHDHQSEYPVNLTDAGRKHPIMQNFPDGWKTPKDELYVIEKLWGNATPLATSTSEKDGKSYPTFWTNMYGQSRVFGTTYGHGNATFEDPVFIKTVTKGILWAAGKLDDDGMPAKGYMAACEHCEMKSN